MSERLEEIKSRVWKERCTYAVGDDSSREGYSYTLSDEDYHWLLEQAVRAQKNAQDLEDMDRQLYSEQQQNKRYRKAINNIIEKAMLFGTNEEVYDAIQEAIQVLEGET